MQKQTQEHQKTREWVALLTEKPEILHREDFYKRRLQNYAKLLEVLNQKIDEAANDEYAQCKLIEEQQDVEFKIETTKNFYKHWSTRKDTYEYEHEIMEAECANQFNFILAEAKKLALQNKALADIIQNWEKDKEVDRPADVKQQMKLDIYVFMKKYIVDHYEYKLKRVFEFPATNKGAVSNLHKVES